MTQRQYKELCKIFEKELTEKDLKKMGFGKVDGKLDSAINEDIALFKVEEYHENNWGKKAMTDEQTEKAIKLAISDLSYCAQKQIIDYIALRETENAILKKNADEAFQQGLDENRKLFEPEIRKETAKEILQELLGYVGSNQKFCMVDDNHKDLIEVDGIFTVIIGIAEKYGVEVSK